jgi:hypothetical protein
MALSGGVEGRDGEATVRPLVVGRGDNGESPS